MQIQKAKRKFFLFKSKNSDFWKVLMTARLPKNTRGFEIKGPFNDIHQCIDAMKGVKHEKGRNNQDNREFISGRQCHRSK